MANHGETDIDKLIAGMKPKLNEGDYVFCLVSNDSEIYNSKISRKDPGVRGGAGIPRANELYK